MRIGFEPHLILGACNPRLAHSALSADRSIGLLLPWNVTLRAVGGEVEVSILDPERNVVSSRRANCEQEAARAVGPRSRLPLPVRDPGRPRVRSHLRSGVNAWGLESDLRSSRPGRPGPLCERLRSRLLLLLTERDQCAGDPSTGCRPRDPHASLAARSRFARPPSRSVPAPAHPRLSRQS